MSIDIIIPVYQAKNTLKRLLYSIAYQKNSDSFNVYLINDADGIDYSDDISIFNGVLRIKELNLSENSGPGVARQYGIDNSSSEFIVFADADDYFYSPFAIFSMYEKISSNNSDLLVSEFIYERDNKVLIKKNNPVWLHGKMYRRSFLNEYNISFNNSRSNEDNGFNRLLLFCKPRVSFLDEITYVYCENSLSITRKNNREYKYFGIEGYAYNMKWAIEEAIKRKVSLISIGNFSLVVLIFMYFYYLELYDQYDVSRIVDWAKPIADIYVKYGNLYKDSANFSVLVQKYFESDFKDSKIKFIISLEEFLNMLGVELCD